MYDTLKKTQYLKLLTNVPAKGDIIAPNLENAEENPMPAFLKENIVSLNNRIFHIKIN